MNIKLNLLFALAAITIALTSRVEAQNTNHIAGTVVSWGSQVIPNASPGTQFTKIAAGGEHNLALKSDGTVVAWGDDTFKPSTIPAGLNGVVAIAAGFSHSLALKSDGTIVAWGDSSFSQTMIPGGLNDAVAIAAGNNYSLALKSNGTVAGWGSNQYGERAVPPRLKCGGCHRRRMSSQFGPEI
jgi:alpha-tubulin suppressor-like RCC1 family protein